MDLQTSLYGLLKNSSIYYGDVNALYFMGKVITYKELINRVDRFASYLEAIGVTKDDCVSICMPNVPQTIYAIYATNRIGAKCSIIHPYTPSNQLEAYMNNTKSDYLIILDISYRHFTYNVKKHKTIIASIKDELTPIKSIVYGLSISKITKDIEYSNHVYKMSNLYNYPTCKEPYNMNFLDTAVYLHSSGTTGDAKTIELSSYAINGVAEKSFYIMETDSFVNTSMLTVLPMFHGFGLALCAHNMLISGGCCTLMPKFNVKQTIKLIKMNRVNYMVGVPTLYEALLKSKKFVKLKELKYIKQTFVGGDFTNVSLKQRFNEVLKQNGSKARLLEGYGLTETVAVNCINRASDEKIDSVGKPIEGYKVKVIDLNTKKEVPANIDGEICVCCDTMMNGYLNDKETTKHVLHLDEQGNKWVHTGDFGHVDEDGYVYLKSRIKRIIKVSGVQVFPSEIEKVVSSLEEIDKACAVSMEDEKKGSVIKLYVSLKNEYKASDELTNKILKHCKENLIIYAVPKKIIYLDKMPLTSYNKIDYRSLEHNNV